MPAILFKCIFFFDQGIQGWTETYYNTATDFPTCATRCNRLSKARSNMLPCSLATSPAGQPVKLKAWRISDDNYRGDAQLEANPDTQQNKSLDNIPPAPAFCCALVRLEAGRRHRRHIQLRGIPDATMAEPFDPTIFPPFQAPMTAFLKILLDANQGWVVKHRNVDQAGAPAVVTVTAVAAGPNAGQWALTLSALGGLTVGSTVCVTNIREMPWLQGRHLVTAIAGPTITIQLKDIFEIQPYLGRGQAQGLAYTTDGIDIAEWIRNSHRDTGRPFDAQAGRRKTRPR
jgi:hypothetical protein